MELPASLRQSVDAYLEHTPLPVLKQAAKTLSERYRAEVRDGRLHMNKELAVKAYLATRLPATYAAARACLAAVDEARPNWSPKSLLDIGSGPGTMLWAVSEAWPDIAHATMVEASTAASQIGMLLTSGVDVQCEWRSSDATLDDSDLPSADLVTAAYLLDEVAPLALPRLLGRLWEACGDTLLIIEPGTPAGWQRIIAARGQLLDSGAHILAPCPHQEPCPLVAPDWCHFARRVARSRVHRLAKEADVPWEDEKFIYIAATRSKIGPNDARVIAPPKSGSGKVQLKLCQADGSVRERMLTKRDGAIFKTARRLNWGNTLPE